MGFHGAAAKILPGPVTPAETLPQPELTDGFHLVIDALKLNDIDTIYGLPGIPITDLARLAQAEGMRVISFRHEQNAGNAAAAAGYLTQKPGICLTVSAPGFLNGLTALANATTNCFPMILISGSSEREVVDLQQGDYEEMDQLAIAKPLCKAAFRVLHAQDIGIGVARAIRAAVSGRPGGVYLDLPAKLFSQTMEAEAGRQSLIKVVDPAPRQIPAADSITRALELLKGAKRPLIVLGKGAAYAQADAPIRALVEKTGIPYLPMSMAKGLLPDTHEQSASAARSYVLPEASPRGFCAGYATKTRRGRTAAAHSKSTGVAARSDRAASHACHGRRGENNPCDGVSVTARTTALVAPSMPSTSQADSMSTAIAPASWKAVRANPSASRSTECTGPTWTRSPARRSAPASIVAPGKLRISPLGAHTPEATTRSPGARLGSTAPQNPTTAVA